MSTVQNVKHGKPCAGVRLVMLDGRWPSVSDVRGTYSLFEEAAIPGSANHKGDATVLLRDCNDASSCYWCWETLRLVLEQLSFLSDSAKVAGFRCAAIVVLALLWGAGALESLGEDIELVVGENVASEGGAVELRRTTSIVQTLQALDSEPLSLGADGGFEGATDGPQQPPERVVDSRVEVWFVERTGETVEVDAGCNMPSDCLHQQFSGFIEERPYGERGERVNKQDDWFKNGQADHAELFEGMWFLIWTLSGMAVSFLLSSKGDRPDLRDWKMRQTVLVSYIAGIAALMWCFHLGYMWERLTVTVFSATKYCCLSTHILLIQATAGVSGQEYDTEGICCRCIDLGAGQCLKMLCTDVGRKALRVRYKKCCYPLTSELGWILSDDLLCKIAICWRDHEQKVSIENAISLAIEEMGVTAEYLMITVRYHDIIESCFGILGFVWKELESSAKSDMFKGFCKDAADKGCIVALKRALEISSEKNRDRVVLSDLHHRLLQELRIGTGVWEIYRRFATNWVCHMSSEL